MYNQAQRLYDLENYDRQIKEFLIKFNHHQRLQKYIMSTKRIVSGFTALTLLVLSIAHVYAYINYNTNGPDVWVNPGYRWNVESDTESGQSVCIQWSVDGGTNWDQRRCQAVGGTSWECQTPDNLLSKTVTYQFYKDMWDDDCAIAGNEWEWTSQHNFSTKPTAVSLQSITANNQSTGIILITITLLLATMGGVWMRLRKQ